MKRKGIVILTTLILLLCATPVEAECVIGEDGMYVGGKNAGQSASTELRCTTSVTQPITSKENSNNASLNLNDLIRNTLVVILLIGTVVVIYLCMRKDKYAY